MMLLGQPHRETNDEREKTEKDYTNSDEQCPATAAQVSFIRRQNAVETI